MTKTLFVFPATRGELQILISASRFPAGWCLAPILFGIGLIHSRSIPKGGLKLLLCIAELGCLTFPLATIVFGLNDVYDYDSDSINPRKLEKGLEGGVLSLNHHPLVLSTALVSSGVIIFITSLSRNLYHFQTAILFLFTAWQYSAPPLRFKEVPVIDSLSNGLIVFLAWLMGYTFGGGKIYPMPPMGLTMSACCAGVHALGAVIDYDWDKLSKTTTIATALGQRLAATFGLTSFVLANMMNTNTNPIFVAYLRVGIFIMATPIIQMNFARTCFQMIVWWGACMAVIWFSLKAYQHAKHLEESKVSGQ